MSVEGFVIGYSLAALAVMLGLIIAARRVGRPRAAMILVLLGLVILASEEALLTLFWAFARPDADEDGMATLLTDRAQAHVLDTAIFATALFVLLGWIAVAAFRRGERWAARVLLAGWIVVATTAIVTSLTVDSRGLFGDGFGWQPLVVGLAAWASGLWLARPATVVSVRSGQ